MRLVVLVLLEPLLERRQLAADFLAAGVHQLLLHALEIEVAQRAIQVVRAADRAAGLHAGEALHGLLGERPHHPLVAAHQRLHQEVHHLLGRQRIHRRRRQPLPSPCCLLLHLAPHLVEIGVAVDQLVLRATEAEVDLEHGLERAPVRVVLHHRGAERVLERLAILDRDVLHRLHRIEVLGERHRDARVAQFGDEPSHQIEHDVLVLRGFDGQLFGCLGDVGLVLQQDVQRVFGLLRVDVLDTEQHERARPVDGLADARRLLQVELTDAAHDACDLVGEVVGDLGDPSGDDELLALEVGVVDVEVEAATLQRLGQLAGVVRGEEHERDLLGRDGAELGNRHLVLGQDLEQQGFGLDLDAVDFVDQQHHRFVGGDGLQQRTREQELVGEDVVVDIAPRVAVLVGLDAEQLLLVVPLVQGLRLIEALVALQADESGTGHLSDALGELGLACTCRSFDEHRLAQPIGEECNTGNPIVGEVVHVTETFADSVHGLETGCHTQRTLLFGTLVASIEYPSFPQIGDTEPLRFAAWIAGPWVTTSTGSSTRSATISPICLARPPTCTDPMSCRKPPTSSLPPSTPTVV